EPRLGWQRTPLRLTKGRCVREERCNVSVGPDSEQQQTELRVAELALVIGGALVLAELALDSMHSARRALEVVEQRLLRHAVVRALVVGWNAPFVAPPDLELAPVGRVLRRLLVCLLRRSPARED